MHVRLLLSLLRASEFHISVPSFFFPFQSERVFVCFFSVGVDFSIFRLRPFILTFGRPLGALKRSLSLILFKASLTSIFFLDAMVTMFCTSTFFMHCPAPTRSYSLAMRNLSRYSPYLTLFSTLMGRLFRTDSFFPPFADLFP